MRRRVWQPAGLGDGIMLDRATVKLAHLPTPLAPLEGLSRDLGVQLWIKRDDLTGLAFGGNKTRKLEYLVADAISRGADTLITTGAPQSNHCRQTAAAAATQGLSAVLVLGGAGVDAMRGNRLLDGLLGAEVVNIGDEDRATALERVANELRAKGRKPYVIPLGGSNALGVTAYRAAIHELREQMEEHRLSRFDRIVVASSSGGTQAGLMVGVRELGMHVEVLGISVDQPASVLSTTVADLANEHTALSGVSMDFSPGDVLVEDSFITPGYAVMTRAEQSAIETFAARDGIILDPVYTGRAGYGLLELISRGKIAQDERILFWHTGGGPALFAYADHWAI